MWSGPRNISKALLRSFENRPDTIVEDEPFYAHYLLKTGYNHPMRNEIINSQSTNWNTIVKRLITEIPNNSTDIWVKMNDPKGTKSLYSKVPEGQDKNAYQREMQTLLSSDRPLSLPKINKVRVVEE